MSQNQKTSTIMARSDDPVIWSSKLIYEGKFSSAIRGHHVHKTTWSPTKGESLALGKVKKPNNTLNLQLGLAFKLKKDMFQWNFPSLYSLYPASLGFSRPDTRLRRETWRNHCWQVTLLKACRDNKVQVKVTGSRRLENGLVVTGSLLARATSRTIAAKFEGEMTRLKELCTYRTWT